MRVPFLAVSFAFLIACTGTGAEDPSAPDARTGDNNPPAACNATNVPTTILTPKCGRCHGKTAPAAGLDLVSAGVENRVVNKTSSCSKDKVAIASDPAKSAIHMKVSGTTCGEQMPKGGPFLSTAEVNCIASWIEKLPAPGAGGDPTPPGGGGDPTPGGW